MVSDFIMICFIFMNKARAYNKSIIINIQNARKNYKTETRFKIEKIEWSEAKENHITECILTKKPLLSLLKVSLLFLLLVILPSALQ